MNKHVTIKHRVKENPVSFGLTSVLACIAPSWKENQDFKCSSTLIYKAAEEVEYCEATVMLGIYFWFCFLSWILCITLGFLSIKNITLRYIF